LPLIVRITHLARDEKFVPLLRQLFEEALPGANHWLIARRRRAKGRFVATAPDVSFRAEWWFRMPWIAHDVAQADVIVAHSMTTIFANAIRRARPGCRIAWIGWGYDYYPLLEALLGDALLPATRALVGTEATDGGSVAAHPHPARWWRALHRGERRKSMALAAMASRIHTFCVMPTEVELLRRAVPALAGVPHELPLFTTEDVFERGPPEMSGPDVLVGNSATASNNHADAFAWLAGRIGNRRIVVPLSYGSVGYGTRVAALGAQLFGDRFDALRDWMPIDAYNERIRRCGFVVMNHRRQQAVGNIGAALFKGATVYLRRENPLFAYYRNLGIALRAVDDLTAGEYLLEPIAPAERLRNRALIAEHYARSRVVQAIRELPALQG
jgi:hypothetical protein